MPEPQAAAALTGSCGRPLAVAGGEAATEDAALAVASAVAAGAEGAVTVATAARAVAVAAASRWRKRLVFPACFDFDSFGFLMGLDSSHDCVSMSARGCDSQFLPYSLLHRSMFRARTFVKCTGFSEKIPSVFSCVTSSKLSGSNRRATCLVKPMPPKGQRSQPTAIDCAPKID